MNFKPWSDCKYNKSGFMMLEPGRIDQVDLFLQYTDR